MSAIVPIVACHLAFIMFNCNHDGCLMISFQCERYISMGFINWYLQTDFELDDLKVLLIFDA